MIDVSNQSPINIEQGLAVGMWPVPGQWPRCRDVTLRDDVLECRLDFARTYSLLEAYRRAPHVEFANATTDRDLVSFLRKWGPLYISPPPLYRSSPPKGVVTLQLFRCRASQRWLRAFVNLLSAFRNAENERESLVEFLEATDRDPVDEPPSLKLLKKRFHIAEHPADWARAAGLPLVRAATDYLIPLAPFYPVLLQVTCQRGPGRRRVTAGWVFRNLEEALLGMVWYDVFNKFPILCCPECSKVKQARTAHPNQKFCSQKCEHRATARKWQKGYNKRKRAERRAERK